MATKIIKSDPAVPPYASEIAPVPKKISKRPIVRIIWVSIAMLCSVVSWAFLLSAHLAVDFDENGLNTSFSSLGLWICSYIFSLIAVAFYVVDAVFCVVRAVKKIDPLFHILLAVLLVGTTPMVLLVGGYGLFDIKNLIWALYHLACFGMEAVALGLSMRQVRKD